MLGYTRLGLVQDAFSFLGFMRERGYRPNNYTLSILAMGCIKLGKPGLSQCWNLFRLFYMIGVKPSVNNYNFLIHGLGSDGQYLEALRMANRIASSGMTW